MTVKTPTLFGRLTAIRQDHAALQRALRRLRASARELAEAREASPAELLRLVEILVGQLQGHFIAEEANAYFGAIAADRPSLRPTIESLCDDHQLILYTLFDFPFLVAAGTPNRELAARLDCILDILQLHERREDQLMQEYLLRGDSLLHPSAG